MKKIIAGIVLSLAVMMTLGTVAFAAPNPDKTPCIAQCTPNGLCGNGVNNVPYVAQHLALDIGGPGASAHAQNTLSEVVDLLTP